MRSPLARTLLVAAVTTFGVYVLASVWGRPVEHDRAAAAAWTWAFSRVAWTPAALAAVAAGELFVVFVLAQLAGIRPREAFWGALAPYPAVLLLDVVVNGGHGQLPVEVARHAAYLGVPLAAALAAAVRIPGQVVEVDGRPLTRAGNLADVQAAIDAARAGGGGVVIVEPFRSGRFVQVVVTGARVVVDVPREPLSDADWTRARGVLEPLGAAPTADGQALQVVAAGDAAAAAELVLRVLADVHGHEPPLELVIETVA